MSYLRSILILSLFPHAYVSQIYVGLVLWIKYCNDFSFSHAFDPTWQYFVNQYDLWSSSTLYNFTRLPLNFPCLGLYILFSFLHSLRAIDPSVILIYIKNIGFLKPVTASDYQSSFISVCPLSSSNPLSCITHSPDPSHPTLPSSYPVVFATEVVWFYHSTLNVRNIKLRFDTNQNKIP